MEDSELLASRRRHTRWPRDWSSDVCSSDLGRAQGRVRPAAVLAGREVVETDLLERPVGARGDRPAEALPRGLEQDGPLQSARIVLRPFQLLTMRIQRPSDDS